MYDIVIIGAGIAGLTAAIYARRAGKSVLVLEKEAYGGQIINTLEIENWPGDFKVSGANLMQKVYNQATALGAEVEFEQVESITKSSEYRDAKDAADEARALWLVKTEDAEYTASAIILAVGAENRKLGLPREDELVGRGISYCATCDGAFYKGKSVAIIGGGNTALDDALYLSDLCKKVYLVHRREEFRGDAATVAKLKEKANVEMVLGFIPEKLEGDKKLEGLVVKNTPQAGQISDPSVKNLSVEGVFVAIGQVPGTTEYSELVDLDDKGYIIAGEDCHTSCPGIFVAGDCRTKSVRQLVTAASDGCIAAAAAVDFLS